MLSSGAAEEQLLNRSILITFLLLSVFLNFACTDLPRDPENTLRQLQSRPMRVGLVEHPPWVVRTSGEPAGVEVDLIRNFASALGTTVEWHWSNEQAQLEALEYYQLDVVIGGFTDRTPWSKYVGLTRPYFAETYRVGIPASSQLENLNGAEVAVHKGEAVAAELEKKGARVTRVDDLAQVQGAVAAPDWQLEQMGLKSTSEELDKVKHVIAVPPGENALVRRLDQFLFTKRFEIKHLLQREASKK
jgi:polar amino acid transport system substrate-binding protein